MTQEEETTILQDGDQQVLLATEIERISNSLQGLRRTGLNEKAIVILVHHDTKVPQRTILKVFESLRELRRTYGDPEGA